MYKETRIVTERTGVLKSMAKSALRDKWRIAILFAIIYAIVLGVPGSLIDVFIFGSKTPIELAYHYSNLDINIVTQDSMSENTPAFDLYNFIIAGPLMLGLLSFVLNLIRGKQIGLDMIFSGFSNFFKAFLLNIVMGIFIFLWMLLLIIPGIIAAYRYSMAFYILVDNPDIGVMQAISMSKEMMRGNKANLFILHLSFIGWALLTGLVAGILAVSLQLLLPNDPVTTPHMAYASIYIVILVLSLIVTSPLLIYMQTTEGVFYRIASGDVDVRINDGFEKLSE